MSAQVTYCIRTRPADPGTYELRLRVSDGGEQEVQLVRHVRQLRPVQELYDDLRRDMQLLEELRERRRNLQVMREELDQFVWETRRRIEWDERWEFFVMGLKHGACGLVVLGVAYWMIKMW
ncbi:hypothetical protein EG328_004077 [Venturia inaequalis]|uniref:GOLD domain-containing protein n=1 Tax=Venturia inaequalis TaxID=5025 RepID=A0A8H3USI0_VENIN|nr:hypothetical protein EG328_004077 [Venturia inaequalis]KAE9989421.1 hypothetical protein EG327_002690 [Venturia inaequalis]RDI76488.1 hypothetical protein Vi05172_g13538 [Venturia inaequalis]